MTPAELIALKKEAEAMNIAIANAEKQILADMLDAGTEQIKAGGGSITLQYRSSKAREKSPEELAIAEAITQETMEMANNNISKLYQLQKQAYMLQMQAAALVVSPWTFELKAKLVAAEKARKENRQAKPVLVFDLPQPSPEELCSAEDYAELTALASNAKPKKFTKYATLLWLKANKHMAGEELIAAFKQRLVEHEKYWSKNSAN